MMNGTYHEATIEIKKQNVMLDRYRTELRRLRTVIEEIGELANEAEVDGNNSYEQFVQLASKEVAGDVAKIKADKFTMEDIHNNKALARLHEKYRVILPLIVDLRAIIDKKTDYQL